MKNNLSILREQKYWQDWIASRGDKNIPLQPFVYSYSQQMVVKTDDLIQGLGSFDNDALFVWVNIDNGVLYVTYLAWNNSENKLDYVETNGLTEFPRTGIRDRKMMGITENLEKLSATNGFVDCKNLIFGESSLYLTVRFGSKINRFAAYAPDFQVDKDQNHMEQFVRHLLNIESPVDGDSIFPGDR